MVDALPMVARRVDTVAMSIAAPAPVEPTVEPPPQPAPAPDPRLVAIPQRKAAARLPELEVGASAGIDRRTADRLRRGQLAIDGRMDLHGMTQAQAHGALASFVHRAWAEGRRCLLVITGKGTFSGDGGGVLRQAVPRWLGEPGLRPMVLAVQPAQPQHGGGGAFYLLLKRRREAGGPSRP
jgi:DNA-nicking Smr family endonuclease